MPKHHWFTSSCGRVEFTLTLDDARSGSHSGACDADVAELRRVPYIAEQLAAVNAEALAEELQGYGAWDAEELADHDENLTRILWIACGDISEEVRSHG